MRLRRRHLPFIALAGALAAVALPGVSTGSAPLTVGAFTGVDKGFDHSWQADGTAANTLTVIGSAVVTFTYPSGSSFHNVVFTGPQPTCTQTAPTPADGAVPPLPHNALGPGWSGHCTFPGPGNYPFVCSLHPGMTGAVVVADPSVTTGTTQTTGTTTTTTTTTPTQPGTTPVTDPVPAPATLTIPRAQRGRAVKVTVRGAPAGARLTATLSAAATSLRARAARSVTFGRLAVAATPAGDTTFTVPLSAAARRALTRHGSLRVSAAATLTPPAGPRVSRRATVTLRRR